jgi:hypothetical protein
VNQSEDPLPEGCVPTLLMSISPAYYNKQEDHRLQ